MILFLDDDPNRAALAYKRWPQEKSNQTMWVTTAEDAIGVLRDYKGKLTEVHLDHDLGGETWVNSDRADTGMEVVRWVQSCGDLESFKDTLFVIHSWNIPAGAEMTKRLADLGLSAKQIPFGS